jgi:hypothetical protein
MPWSSRKKASEADWYVFRPSLHLPLLTTLVLKIFRRHLLLHAIRGSNIAILPLACSASCGYAGPPDRSQMLVKNRESKKCVFVSVILRCRRPLAHRHIFIKFRSKILSTRVRKARIMGGVSSSAHLRVCLLRSMSQSPLISRRIYDIQRLSLLD